LIGLLAASAVVSAHHSHPVFYDMCRTLTIDGRITRVELKNPHSMVDVETDAGTTYHVELTSAQLLARRFGSLDALDDALKVGSRLVVTAHPHRTGAEIRVSFPELQGEPVPNTIDPVTVRRADNSFNWTVAPDTTPDCAGQ
jgi:hypothetical protein